MHPSFMVSGMLWQFSLDVVQKLFWLDCSESIPALLSILLITLIHTSCRGSFLLGITSGCFLLETIKSFLIHLETVKGSKGTYQLWFVFFTKTLIVSGSLQFQQVVKMCIKQTAIKFGVYSSHPQHLQKWLFWKLTTQGHSSIMILAMIWSTHCKFNILHIIKLEVNFTTQWLTVIVT